MSRSGVAVGDEVQQAFQELKLGKSVKYIIFKLNPSKTEIVVDSKGTEPDYDTFLSKLPEDDGRYAVYDFEYDSGEGKRNKIIFYTWSPDTAPVRSKMVYAASKDALRRSLNGIATEIQGTDFSEVAFDSVLDKITRQTGSH